MNVRYLTPRRERRPALIRRAVLGLDTWRFAAMLGEFALFLEFSLATCPNLHNCAFLAFLMISHFLEKLSHELYCLYGSFPRRTCTKRQVSWCRQKPSLLHAVFNDSLSMECARRFSKQHLFPIPSHAFPFTDGAGFALTYPLSVVSSVVMISSCHSDFFTIPQAHFRRCTNSS